MSINEWARPSGMPAATQRSQNTEKISVSGVPARPAFVSHADNSPKKLSFMPGLYRHSAGIRVLTLLEVKRTLPFAPHMSAFDPKRTSQRSIPFQRVSLGGYDAFPAVGALMRRREFLGILGGAAAWPIVSKAQQAERVRLVGVLNILASDDPEGQARTAVFEQTLQELGWAVGRDLKIETRQIGPSDSLRRYAAELVALAPDVILSIGSIALAPLQQATRTIPIVFVNVPDPVGAASSKVWATRAAISPASRISSTA